MNYENLNDLSEETTAADRDLRRRTSWIDRERERREEIRQDIRRQRTEANRYMNPWAIFANMEEKGAYFFHLRADLPRGVLEGCFEYPAMRDGGRGLDWELHLADVLEGARQQGWVKSWNGDTVTAIEDVEPDDSVEIVVPISDWIEQLIYDSEKEKSVPSVHRVLVCALREYFSRELDKAQREAANLKDLPDSDSYQVMIAYRALRFLQDYIRHTRPSCVV